MAEAIAFDAAELLLRKLTSYAYQEVSRAYGVYKDLRVIKDTLTIVRCLLLDAEEKKNQQHALREWLRQTQNICSDAEDVLEGFDLQDKRKQVIKDSRSTSMKVRHFFSSSNPLAFRIKMARQIKDIRNRLDKVAYDGTRFGLATINVEPGLVVHRREMTYPDVDASSVIGRESDREEIIKLLMQPHPHGDDDGDKSMCVIPIVGIGGLGKTTLAKLVFNDKRVDQLFQLKMWACVSNDFDIRQIIIKIVNSASTSKFASTSASSVTFPHQENINNLDIVQLVSCLRSKISGQKFLLVLDDIWNDDRAKWTELKDLIKVGTVGSKMMVTTRSKSISSMMGTVPSYVLHGLSVENCLFLFVKSAFKEGEEEKFPNLVAIGKEIVKKCHGVPLAVKTLGSSLFSKFDLNKWKFVRDSEIWNLEQKKDDILPALKLSYDQMPSYLRHCFAYFSLYPKDFTFLAGDITSLWVALGLVQPRNGNENLENVAREYIDELHSRSFLLDFDDIGHFFNFKVHDLVHDLALYVAKEECVLVQSNTRNIPEQARHLSIFENDSLGHALFLKSKQVRTILFPIDRVGLDRDSLLDTWVSRYKYLRILDLSDSSMVTLPISIAKLEHLRVLNLTNNCKIKRLPHSICKLLNLQVLLLTGCMELETLPNGLGKLISLRQLFITTKQFVLPQNEFASFKHLHTLDFYRCDNLKFLFNGTRQLTFVETLSVQSCGSLESLSLYSFPKLQTLYLADCKMLTMSLNNESPIQRMPMRHLYLEEFPGLLTLPRWIVGIADTLETLVITKFPNLKMLPKCFTALTHLKRLDIRHCPQLSTLPNDIQRLTALEDLRIYRCRELCQKCRPQFGEYWPMIAHIKRISIGKQKLSH
ncbi:putative disease resistance protein RGA4 [Cicer arietinum]|uniref:CC-NBS-LRR disease resistance protein n=1 Tax=Cicer arietinum TaxID=3827 RepID=A0A067XSL0_CICAR|nr:putative disease resistance protein RGA4 [Cicer arietinum]AGT75398.1 CC-NBS-LRR disease resistance protein [Cicer arietinum]